MENFPNPVKEIDMQVPEALTVTNKMNPKRPTPRHIIISMGNIQDKENLKSTKRKAVNYKGAPRKL